MSTDSVNPAPEFNVAEFVPRCVVCTNPVPPKRARGRSKDTCSPPCHAKLREYRKFVIFTARCPSCYHPCTPDERDDFREWRRHRGDRRHGRGRPPKVKPMDPKLLAQKAAALVLRTAGDVEQLTVDNFLSEFQKSEDTDESTS